MAGLMTREELRYQVDERAPMPTTIGIGLQHAVLSLSSMMLMPTVAFRAGGASDAAVVWAVFASMTICGAIIALHARPVGRFGAGYVLAIGPTGPAIAVTADALNAGGPAMLALLVLMASAVQFAFALRMSLLRRLLTPTVSGTAMMLIPVTIFPVMFDMLDEAPPEAPEVAAPLCAAITFLVVGGIMLKGTAGLRNWAPVCGIVLGSIAAAFYGLYDFERVAQAAWFGAPTQWPTHYAAITEGLDLEAFVGLAPAFILLFLICAIRSMSSSLAIQTVSWRTRRAPDFRPVQGVVAGDALSNLAAGLAGTMPNGANSGTIARTQLSGVASRPVGLVYGAAVLLLAFCPKVVALVLAVPAPVFAGYVTIMIASVFTVGLKMAVSEGVDSRQGLIIGLAFWIGAGCQYGFIFPEFIAAFAGGMLKSALTTGGLVAILMTSFLLVTAPRKQRFETELALSTLPRLRGFVQALAKRRHLPAAMVERLDAVCEEALLTLLGDQESLVEQHRRLRVLAFVEADAVVLEFAAAGGQENIEDRLAVLGETATGDSVERDLSLRLLRHLASDVRHRQYYDVDIVSLRVERAASRD